MNDLTEFLLDRLGVPSRSVRHVAVRLSFHGVKPLKGIMREVRVDEPDWPQMRALLESEATPARDPDGAMRAVLHQLDAAERDAEAWAVDR